MRVFLIAVLMTVAYGAVAQPSMDVVAQSYESIAGKVHLRLTVRTDTPGALVIRFHGHPAGEGNCNAVAGSVNVYQCTAISPVYAWPDGLPGLILTQFWVEGADGLRSRVADLTELL